MRNNFSVRLGHDLIKITSYGMLLLSNMLTFFDEAYM